MEDNVIYTCLECKEVIEKDTGVKSYLIEKTSSKEIKLKVMGIIAESEIKSICGKFSLKDLKKLFTM